MLTIPQYQITDKLYVTDKITIYRGINLKTNQIVILKMLTADYPSEENIAQLRHEYNILKKLNIPNVIRTYGFEKVDHKYILILEDVPDGQTLSTFLSKTQIDIETFLFMAIQLADLLYSVHLAHIIHKDVNPYNIVISGDARQIKLIDFGIATQLSHEPAIAQGANALKGTLAYISPEQTGRMNRTVDHRTDLYSLGVTFYQMLSGHLPFEAKDPIEWVHNHIAKQPISIQKYKPDIPDMLVKIIMKLMAKNAEDRYITAYGLKSDLEYCAKVWGQAKTIPEFPLGKNDRAGMFQISQKLYGRDSELQLLLTAFDEIKEGKKGLVLVSGYSGIGKSALINEIHKPIVRQRGYFASGKFEQLKKNMPYLGIIQAFRQIIKQLLSEDAECIASWRKKILKELHGNGHVIIDVLPELEKLIGIQPLLPDLSVIEKKERFENSFFDFIRVFAQADHPFVLFLDDLQWIDISSLNLVQKILSDASLKYFLLIGAYRHNEVDEGHPLLLAIRDLIEVGIKPTNIIIKSLNLSSIQQLIADSINASPNENTLSLAQLVLEKTGGNPFFINSFLAKLYQEKYITFNYSENIWSWNLDVLKTLAITDNLAKLLTENINHLPQDTQNAIKIAACIGNQFNLKALALACNRTSSEVAQSLWEAINQNLLVPLNNEYIFAMEDEELAQKKAQYINYKFSHDQVQQACYLALPKKQKQLIQLTIGRTMLSHLKKGEIEEAIFEIVNHLNSGINLVSEVKEKIEIAKLNVQAAEKAKLSIAYESAFIYFKKAISILGKNSWKTHYDLLWKASLGYADVTYLLGKFKKASRLFDNLFIKAKSNTEKAKIIYYQIESYIFQKNLEKALEVGLNGLNSLDEEKIDIHIGQGKVIFELIKTMWALRGKSTEDILSLPKMTDPFRILVLELRMAIYQLGAFVRKPNITGVLIFRNIRDHLKYGICSCNIQDFCSYAAAIFTIFKDVDRASIYANVSLKTVENNDEKKAMIISYTSMYSMIAPWKVPFKKCIKYLKKAFQLRWQTDEIVYSSLAGSTYAALMYINGNPLKEVIVKHKEVLSAMSVLKKYDAYQVTVLLSKLIQILRGKRAVNKFREYANVYMMKENKKLRTAEIYQTTACIDLLKVGYFLEDWDYSLKLIESQRKNVLDPVISAIPGVFTEYYFYSALTYLNIKNRSQYKKQIYTALNKFKKWSQGSPENFASKFYILSMLVSAYIDNNFHKSYFDYNKAISFAMENHQTNLTAMTSELFGKINLYFGYRRSATPYLQEAISAYKAWGAMVKVDSLNKQYNDMDFVSSVNKSLTTQTRTLSSDGIINIDFSSIIKSTQSISSYVRLDELLHHLILILIENAGAERGVLLLFRHQQFWVEAEGNINQSEPLVLQHQLVDTRDDICQPIISYVINTHTNIVLDDAMKEGQFTENSYIIHSQARSLLCSPILYQNKLLGIIYLENKLTAGAFTAARIEMLRLLSGQVAISLENALYYTAYNQFVPHEFLDLLGKRSIIDVELGDHIQKEMTVMFTDIRQFTNLSENLTAKEVFYFINSYLGIMEPIVTTHYGFIDKYIGDAIMALFHKSCEDAVLAGIEMQNQLTIYNIEHAKKFKKVLRIGIGINFGSLMLGTLGGKNRMETSVLSDAVNLAARLEKLTKNYDSPILLSDAVYQQLKQSRHQFSFRFVGKISIRGKKNNVLVWEEYSSESPELYQAKCAIQSSYDQAINLFYNNQFKEALQIFEQCKEKLPKDKLIEEYIENCKKLNT